MDGMLIDIEDNGPEGSVSGPPKESALSLLAELIYQGDANQQESDNQLQLDPLVSTSETLTDLTNVSNGDLVNEEQEDSPSPEGGENVLIDFESPKKVAAPHSQNSIVEVPPAWFAQTREEQPLTEAPIQVKLPKASCYNTNTG
jgi:hypothetical protein